MNELLSKLFRIKFTVIKYNILIQEFVVIS
ncbi:hypothetical protein CPAST_c07570 [Clostridium pasteurianum DSM 525 = ATCC 6013]|uniref:Uncharacterized protein n=1 Tax=Clostridium pasteurianum DSM 525 = ATCC 6013 TaxID=1262449 RepID=A0A0H3J272_CLOPA|nr:hypothetical protein CPAST_c07570 [Clostridium pasteurianum DSM 525 = ATCC 6013]AJA50845.1 hypothetical protein CLPA_c07570 [Clostridium pasteurianum DSM 525 = ATCC 6013]